MGLAGSVVLANSVPAFGSSGAHEEEAEAYSFQQREVPVVGEELARSDGEALERRREADVPVELAPLDEVAADERGPHGLGPVAEDVREEGLGEARRGGGPGGARRRLTCITRITDCCAPRSR